MRFPNLARLIRRSGLINGRAALAVPTSKAPAKIEAVVVSPPLTGHDVVTSGSLVSETPGRTASGAMDAKRSPKVFQEFSPAKGGAYRAVWLCELTLGEAHHEFQFMSFSGLQRDRGVVASAADCDLTTGTAVVGHSHRAFKFPSVDNDCRSRDPLPLRSN